MALSKETLEKLRKVAEYQKSDKSVLSPKYDKFYEKEDKGKLTKADVKKMKEEGAEIYSLTKMEPLKTKSKRRRVGRPRKRKGIPTSRKIQVGATRLLSQFVPLDLPRSSYSYKQYKRRVGRPRGPSGKYVIPGVGAVGVFKYRKWLRSQLALRNLERGREYNPQFPEEAYQEYPEQLQGPTYTHPQRPLQRELPYPQIQRPNVLQTPPSDNILNAPNVARGELRGVGQSSALINVDDLNRPVTNKGGDYYTEVDPLSGKQILHRRVRERWLS